MASHERANREHDFPALVTTLVRLIRHPNKAIRVSYRYIKPSLQDVGEQSMHTCTAWCQLN